MKNKENQEFKSSGVILVLCLVGLCLFVAIAPWSPAEKVGKTGAAKQKAEVVGYQILQSYKTFEASKSTKADYQKRGVASVSESSGEVFKDQGVIGSDPWGRSYSYKLHKVSEPNSTEQKPVLLVWSKGEDGIDNSYSEFNSGLSANQQIEFLYDDIGVILPIQD